MKILVVRDPALVQSLLEPCQELQGSLVFSFSIQAVGFDVTPQALRVAESVTLAVDVKGNEMATLAVLIQLQVGVMCGPLHDGTFGATPWVSNFEKPHLVL